MATVRFALLTSLALLTALVGNSRAQDDSLELVETAPVHTTLDSPDLRNAHEVWIEAIDAARSTIELAHFYASDAPPKPDGSVPRTRLTAVVEALERAGHRGVRIRFLLSEAFHSTYPELAARLDAEENIEVRWLDLEPHGDGVLHAKYMLFDSTSVFVGSQNFDWRALEHIQELGVLARSPRVAGQFSRVFEEDWSLAAGQAGALDSPGPLANRVPLAEGSCTPVFSPAGLIPVGLEWDLPHLIEMIDGARETVRVQLLSYSPTDRSGSWFGELDTALRHAAARGVDVRLTVADWGKRSGRVEWLQSLAPVPNLEVRMVTIPPAPEGHIPFARVVHAKYLVVDGASAWVGTSNWSSDYFYASRNAGLRIDGGTLPARLVRFHADLWQSPYAYAVDPGATYTPPRVGE